MDDKPHETPSYPPKVDLALGKAEISEMKTPEIPIPEKPRPFTASKDYFKSQCMGREGRPFFTGCLLDLPVKDRAEYMWMIPDEIKKECCYDQEPEHFKINHCKIMREERENNEKKEQTLKKDQEATIKQQAAQIQALIAHTTALTQAVNSIIAQSKA